MYFGIYSITNVVTGDMYVGQTIQGFEKRWKSHIRALNRGNHDNEYLQRSWNKYGEGAFKFKAIHYCDELDILNDLEKYYIKKYDTYNNGFNMTEGGDYFLNEIPEEIRKKRLEKIKKINRERSDYTEHQIAKVKEMLSELENNPISIKKISKLTGVRESVIYGIKNLNSWIDVRSDLNEKLKIINNKETRNENIVKDLCMIEFLPELIKSGVTTLSIEGNMKSDEYMEKALKIYRKAIDKFIENPEKWQLNRVWLEELQSLDHRVLTTGFYLEENIDYTK